MAQQPMSLIDAIVTGLKRRAPRRRKQDETSDGFAARSARLRSAKPDRFKVDSAELIRPDRDER